MSAVFYEFNFCVCQHFCKTWWLLTFIEVVLSCGTLVVAVLCACAALHDCCWSHRRVLLGKRCFNTFTCEYTHLTTHCHAAQCNCGEECEFLRRHFCKHGKERCDVFNQERNLEKDGWERGGQLKPLHCFTARSVGCIAIISLYQLCTQQHILW